MKIVYCVDSLGVGFGIERVTTVKANYLVSLGHEVTIVTGDLGGRTPQYGLSPDIKIIDLELRYFEDFSYPIASRLLRTVRKMYRHYTLMRQFLREYQPDVVISTHKYETLFLPYLHKKSLKVIEFHVAKAIYRLQTDSYGRLRKLLYKLYEFRDDFFARSFDKVIVLTQDDYRLRGARQNMQVIPNPLPFQTEERSSLDKKIVLALGRFEPEKNLSELIKIWGIVYKKHPEWKLKLVGRGYLYNELDTLRKELGLEQAIDFGEETADVIPIYKNASIYAMTSKSEGFGMVLIEAQSIGLPIVSYDCPCGPKDVITHSVNGFLVPPGDQEQFALYLDQLLSDQELRMSMGEKAVESSYRYDIDHVMKTWLEVFNQREK